MFEQYLPHDPQLLAGAAPFVGWRFLLFHSQRTGCWGFQRFPVICGLKTTKFDGMKLLQGRPEGTFLLRLSSTPGALVVMYVKRRQEASHSQYRGRVNEYLCISSVPDSFLLAKNACHVCKVFACAAT